jgi:hypothetical protein
MSLLLATPPRQLASLFESLADRWRAETLLYSSTTDIATNTAYQRIIGLGPQVLPLIFRELEKKPEHWFWALAAITGENPIPDGDAGRMGAMAAAWLKWGRANGWIE